MHKICLIWSDLWNFMIPWSKSLFDMMVHHKSCRMKSKFVMLAVFFRVGRPSSFRYVRDILYMHYSTLALHIFFSSRDHGGILHSFNTQCIPFKKISHMGSLLKTFFSKFWHSFVSIFSQFTLLGSFRSRRVPPPSSE